VVAVPEDQETSTALQQRVVVQEMELAPVLQIPVEVAQIAHQQAVVQVEAEL
jgi:hypothetical protein